MSQLDIAELKWNISEIMRNDPYYSSIDSTVVVFIAVLVKLGYTGKITGVNGKTNELIEHEVKHNSGIHNDLIAEVYNVYCNDIKSLSESSLVSLVEILNKIRLENEMTQCGIIESLTEFSLDSLSKSPTTSAIPVGLPELMKGLTQANNEKGKSMYIPFSGSGDLLLIAPEVINLESTEQNRKLWAISKLRFLISKPKSTLKITNDDPIDNWNLKNKKYDYIMSIPPFGLKIGDRQSKGSYGYFRTIDQFIIEKGIESLNDNGRLVLTIPQGFLFNSDSYSIQLKRFLVDQNYLEAVISLPKNIFSFTSIYTAVLVFQKSKISKQVKFIDGTAFVKKKGKLNEIDYVNILKLYESRETDNSFKLISSNEIASYNYNLSVSRYVAEAVEGNPLKEIVTLYRGTRSEFQLGKVVKIKDLKDTLADYVLNVETIESVEISRRHRQVNQSCILIAARFKTCKPTYFEFKGEPIFIDHNVFAILPNENKVSVDYLIYLLHTAKVISQIESLQIGSATPFISSNDFLRVKVDLPNYQDQSRNLEEQRRIFAEAQASDQSKMLLGKSLNEEIERNRLQYNEELREKQHCIRQHLKNVVDSISVINTFMDRQNGTISKDDIINPIRNITVAQRLDALNNSLKSLNLEIDNLTNDELYDTPEIIEIRDIIRECTLELGDTKGFVVQEFFDDFTLEEFGNSNPGISISKRSFKELFNNIVMNAKLHGFIKEYKEYLIKVIITIEEGKLKLSIVNDGKPFAEGISKQLGVKGKKAGSNAGSGIGVWKVFEIAKQYDFECKIIDLPDDEFPVGWEFKFGIAEK
jgi:type I restriction enzyme M protein